MSRFTIGLRSKVILLASFLLVLPWLGYHYIWEMEKILRQGQLQTLIGTTRAVATALHERPALFNEPANFLPLVEAGKDLYAYDLKQTIELDGRLTDWQENSRQSRFYGQSYIEYQADKQTDNPITFTHMIGKRNGYLYGYLQVNNKSPVLRNTNTRTIDNNDHLIIALTSPQGELQRYIISVYKAGWFNAFSLPVEHNKLRHNKFNEQQREKRIQGFWKLTPSGYNIEFRLPLTMLGDKLGFALHTVTSHAPHQVDTIIATSDIQSSQTLGTVLVPSPEIKKILKGIGHSHSRIWVVDRHQRVLAKTGDIRKASGVWGTDQQTGRNASSLWQRLHGKLIAPLYQFFLDNPQSDFVDELNNATQLNSEFISQALNGKSQSSWSLTKDKKAMILSAASPIMVGEHVMGMVVAEETTNGIRTLRNNALEKLFNVLLTIIFVGTALLLLFASHIASRIRRLRDQADQAIDEQGRLLAPFVPSTAGDEIGELSRSLSEMVDRLGQYHFYLENLSSRLSHELRTPIAVIRSSLENLSLLPQNQDNQKYIARAEQGIKRLNRILTSMREATRIEQSLQSCEKEQVLFNELIEGCVQGYQMTYPDYRFILNNSNKKLPFYADPDFIVQLLDKLISNAMEFSEPQNPITISLNKQADNAQLSIINKGPLLADNMSDELFKSMVSLRPQNKQKSSHLGLGLFISKMICEYHQGKITIADREDKQGVIVIVSFPLVKS